MIREVFIVIVAPRVVRSDVSVDRADGDDCPCERSHMILVPVRSSSCATKGCELVTRGEGIESPLVGGVASAGGTVNV